MTTNKLLQATGDELSRMLGEVLQPEKRNHARKQVFDKEVGYTYDCYFCGKRYEGYAPLSRLPEEPKEPCIPTPIPLTWESAMAWRDWAVGEYGEAMFMENLLYAMVDDGLLSPKESRTEIISGIVAKTQPEHYLKAAALCKLKQDKE